VVRRLPVGVRVGIAEARYRERRPVSERSGRPDVGSGTAAAIGRRCGTPGCSIEALREAEQHYIDRLRSWLPELGFFHS
jgi:hypothetical protein